MDPGADSCFHNFAVRRVGASIADILHDGSREQEDILLNDPDALAEALLREVADIVSVHGHTAAGHIVKARDQVAHGGLSAAGLSHQRDSLPGRDVQADMIEDLRAVVVREGDVLKCDIAFHIRQDPGIRGVLDLGLRPHQLHKPVKSGHALRVDLHELHELADR